MSHPSKKTAHTIVFGGEQYGYSLTDNGDDTTKLICREARLNQDFANEDIAETIQLLPEYIKNARKFLAKHDLTIRFRVSLEEKIKIVKNSKKSGFDDVSKFLRSRALTSS
ncbi:hypothetical protein KAI54_01790 [Candidatus Gracilibacteria bacterium]|nr:hypothetical protein [Candidatus Gracilibacteria bacterium]